MIKSKGNLGLSIVYLAIATVDFADRDATGHPSFHHYTWLLWALCAAFWLYRAFRPGAPQLPHQRPAWRTLPPGKAYLISTVLFVAVALALPLWREFHEPDQPFWNGFLALFLAALVAGTFVGVRYLQRNQIEFGDGRLVREDADAL